MKYVDELVILVEEDTLLIGIGRCNGMEMKVGKKEGKKKFKAIIPTTDYDRSKTFG